MRASLLKSLEGDLADGLSRECFNEITSNPSLRARVVGSVPRKQALDIYARRARHSQERNLSIEGFPRLIQSLACEDVKEVKLYDFYGRQHYFLFVDSDTEKILGILRFPQNFETPNAPP